MSAEPSTPPALHPGELHAQARSGVAAEAARMAAGILSNHVTERVRARLAKADFAILAARDQAGHPRAYLASGPPGSFLAAADPGELRLRAEHGLPGELLGSLAFDDRVGLVALCTETRERARVNGHARVDAAGALAIRVEEAFPNCPKYIQQRVAWLDHVAPAPSSEERRTSALDLEQQTFISDADTFFVASACDEYLPDASHRGGSPGFVRVEPDGTLAWADYAGNNLLQTLGNLVREPRVGLLFVEFETGRTLSVAGRATLAWNGPDIGRAATGRVVRVAVEEAALHPARTPRRWRLLDRSPVNPGPDEGLPLPGRDPGPGAPPIAVQGGTRP